MICADCSHEEKFHFLLSDSFNMEGDIILSVVDEINFSHRKVKVVVFLVFFDFKKLFPPALIRRIYDGMCSIKERGSYT